MQRDADGKTLYITADPQEKGLPLCLQMLGQSKIPVDRIIIPYTQLWRVFPTSDGDSDSGATARLQNYTYKSFVMDAPNDHSAPVQLFSWESNRHKNQLFHFDLQ